MASPKAVFDRLLARSGPQHWWPAETRFEIIVGALLMAQTGWRNVEAAIRNLKGAGLLDPRALADAPLSRIQRLVRPAGLYRVKPRRLQGFCRHLVHVAGGNLDRFFARDLRTLREELLSLDGIGPETADSVLLYAGGFPTFVVDTYTVRIGRRIGWFSSDRYEDVKGFMESSLPPDVGAYQEFHALLVVHGKEICRPRPRCPSCPVARMCEFYRSGRPKRPSTRKNPTKRLL